jgi:hypothetical protein
MNKKIYLTLIIFTLILTACTSNANTPVSNVGSSNSRLTMQSQLVVGTIKLEDSDYAVTSEQAEELLPMWYVLQELNESDNAAQAEIDSLVKQIQETMADEQMQAITDMSLTQQDVVALMQEKGSGVVQSSGNNNGTSSQSNSGSGAGSPPDGGGGMPMDAPPDAAGGMPSGGQPSTGSNGATTNSAQPSMGTGVPSALIEALIEILESKNSS